MRRFGCLCNQFLPKTLRFSLQRHKTWEFGLRRIPGIICRFSPWNLARCFRIQRKLNSGLWLGAFGKQGLFRCQSRSFRPSRQASGGILFWLLVKQGKTLLFSKVVKYKGEGKPTLSMRWFPLSLFIYPKLCSFGLLLKMRCIFYTEQSFTDQCFCRLCNLGLSKKLRFSLQRHKS